MASGDSAEMWSMEKMLAYFTIAKEINPQLTPAASRVLQAYYRAQRAADMRNAARTTMRLLQSMIRLSQAHARLLLRKEVLVQDAVIAVTLMESSMQGAALLGGVNILHTAFPKDADEEYQMQAELILNRLDLGDLVKVDAEQRKAARAEVTPSQKGASWPGTPSSVSTQSVSVSQPGSLVSQKSSNIPCSRDSHRFISTRILPNENDPCESNGEDVTCNDECIVVEREDSVSVVNTSHSDLFSTVSFADNDNSISTSNQNFDNSSNDNADSEMNSSSKTFTELTENVGLHGLHKENGDGGLGKKSSSLLCEGEEVVKSVTQLTQCIQSRQNIIKGGEQESMTEGEVKNNEDTQKLRAKLTYRSVAAHSKESKSKGHQIVTKLKEKIKSPIEKQRESGSVLANSTLQPLANLNDESITKTKKTLQVKRVNKPSVSDKTNPYTSIMEMSRSSISLANDSDWNLEKLLDESWNEVDDEFVQSGTVERLTVDIGQKRKNKDLSSDDEQKGKSKAKRKQKKNAKDKSLVKCDRVSVQHTEDNDQLRHNAEVQMISDKKKMDKCNSVSRSTLSKLHQFSFSSEDDAHNSPSKHQDNNGENCLLPDRMSTALNIPLSCDKEWSPNFSNLKSGEEKRLHRSESTSEKGDDSLDMFMDSDDSIVGTSISTMEGRGDAKNKLLGQNESSESKSVVSKRDSSETFATNGQKHVCDVEAEEVNEGNPSFFSQFKFGKGRVISNTSKGNARNKGNNVKENHNYNSTDVNSNGKVCIANRNRTVGHEFVGDEEIANKIETYSSGLQNCEEELSPTLDHTGGHEKRGEGYTQGGNGLLIIPQLSQCISGSSDDLYSQDKSSTSSYFPPERGQAQVGKMNPPASVKQRGSGRMNKLLKFVKFPTTDLDEVDLFDNDDSMTTNPCPVTASEGVVSVSSIDSRVSSGASTGRNFGQLVSSPSTVKFNHSCLDLCHSKTKETDESLTHKMLVSQKSLEQSQVLLDEHQWLPLTTVGSTPTRSSQHSHDNQSSQKSLHPKEQSSIYVKNVPNSEGKQPKVSLVPKSKSLNSKVFRASASVSSSQSQRFKELPTIQATHQHNKHIDSHSQTTDNEKKQTVDGPSFFTLLSQKYIIDDDLEELLDEEL